MENNNRPQQDCLFCTIQSYATLVAERETAIALYDKNPVTKNHLLILPRRHVEDYFSLTPKEKCDADALLEVCRKIISDNDPSITGFNIGINCGESAGQTIFHCHIHLIPRRVGDTQAPRGGVRGVIPGKMDYPV